MPWQLTDAKSRFSELFKCALENGPQEVTRRGRERVFVVSGDDYERLTGERPSFKSLLFDGPTLKGLDLTRDQDPGRETPTL